MKLKSLVGEILVEAADPRAQYALGYRQAQKDYNNETLQSDFTGLPDVYKQGYKHGVRDARLGRFNNAVLRILTSFGDFLGRWNIGGRG